MGIRRARSLAKILGAATALGSAVCEPVGLAVAHHGVPGSDVPGQRARVHIGHAVDVGQEMGTRWNRRVDRRSSASSRCTATEQAAIEAFGGDQRAGGTSANGIRGVAEDLTDGDLYADAIDDYLCDAPNMWDPEE